MDSGSPPLVTLGRLLSALSVASVGAAAASLLGSAPLADVFFAAWVLGGVAVSLVGAGGAWTGRTALSWLAALSLTGLSILGAWSVGLLVAPAALFMLGSALLLQWAGVGEEDRAGTVAGGGGTASDPLSGQEAASKTLVGAGVAVLGAWLVYVGSLTRELFGACAAETLDCAVAEAHWDALGTTLLGLLLVGVGGWLVWRQVSGAVVSGWNSDRI